MKLRHNENDIIQHAAKVLLDEARALQECAERLQRSDASRKGYRQAIQLMNAALESGGKIVVTGVGKSGKIAEKIVATMLSTGTHATFLHPVEAMHGDLGVVGEKDVVLALSFSGNTEELMRMVPSLNHRGVPIIGLSGNPKSQLAKCCQAWIDGFVAHEVCPDVPAPTSSTTLALALGDAIALSLARQRQFTKHGFALNHPGGSLGRRLLLKVKDVMVPVDQVASVLADASLDVVIMEMTRYPKCGGVVVLRRLSPKLATAGDGEDENLLTPPSSSATSDEDQSYPMTANNAVHALDDTLSVGAEDILGIITHSNIHHVLKTAARDSIFDICARDVMTCVPVVCSVDDLASEAMKIMVENNPKNVELPLLPVIDPKNPQEPWRGVVTLKDLQELF